MAVIVWPGRTNIDPWEEGDWERSARSREENYR